MRRKPVESSNINSIGHNFLTKNLEVEFKGGNVYRYKKVPRHVYKDFIGADSKGRYFYRNIRFDYPYRKYQDEDGNKVKGEWRTLQRKTASEMIDEMCKEAGLMDSARGLGQNLLSSAKSLGAKRIAINAGKGAIGGAITGATTGALNAQEDEHGHAHRFANAMKGALAGGTIGAGIGAGSSIVANMSGANAASNAANAAGAASKTISSAESNAQAAQQAALKSSLAQKHYPKEQARQQNLGNVVKSYNPNMAAGSAKASADVFTNPKSYRTFGSRVLRDQQGHVVRDAFGNKRRSASGLNMNDVLGSKTASQLIDEMYKQAMYY